MIIVLDTNVLVSGLLKGNSIPGSIIRLVATGRLQVAHDSRILAEYAEVLARPKFGFEKSEIKAIIDQIEIEGIMVTAPPLALALPDPDDNPFLEVAKAAKNVPLVTGNKKHFPSYVCGKIVIYDPAEFIEFWLKNK